jgi:hypothetical protein
LSAQLPSSECPRFDGENWSDVVPDVQIASSEVESAASDLKQSADALVSELN